jgi:hypothetical protein
MIVEKLPSKYFFFLISYREGSKAADKFKTRISKPEDLYPQLIEGNEHVTCFALETTSSEIADMLGKALAFDDFWDPVDSVYNVVEVTYDDFVQELVSFTIPNEFWCNEIKPENDNAGSEAVL